MNIYLAGPFFNKEQLEVIQILKTLLEKYGHNVFSPMHEFICPPDADDKTRKDCFNGNMEAIESCDAIIAVTDGKDMGTLFEAGAAYQLRTSRSEIVTAGTTVKPAIYYFAQTLGTNKFNLMLACSCDGIFRSYEELEVFLRDGKVAGFEGQIQ